MTKQYDLEERTMQFSMNVIRLCKKLPFNRINSNLINQLTRSAMSIGANYREANETDTKRDFQNKIRITKKEAKETIYWLKLTDEANPGFNKEIIGLLDESCQLMKILAAIYMKTKIYNKNSKY